MNALKAKVINLMALNHIASEAQLAGCIDTDLPTFSRLFSGKINQQGYELITKLANFFKIPVTYLLVDDALENIYIAEAERYHSSPSAVLRYLMKDIGNISEGELSRRTGVPQPTIHRILSGTTPNPRNAAIDRLAEFFNVSSDQMLSRVPLPSDRIPGSFTLTVATKKVVPLLNWDEIAHWPAMIHTPNLKAAREWEVSESGIKGLGFAVRISNADYFPEFREGTVIVIDCARDLKEGNFALGQLKKNNMAILGQFSIRNQQGILIPLTADNTELLINQSVTILGVVAEAKHRF